MVGDYGRPERMGWGRCFSLRSHSSPLIESHQVFFSHRRKPYSVTMVVDLTCDHWLVLPRRICKGERRCRAKVAALVAVIRILVLLGVQGVIMLYVRVGSMLLKKVPKCLVAIFSKETKL